MAPIVSLLLCLLLLAGCSLPGSVNLSQVATEPTLDQTDPAAASPLTQTATSQLPSETLPSPIATPDSTQATRTSTRYTLQVQFDYWGHTLAVSETIEYTNNSPDELSMLYLDVEANRWKGSFSLDLLAWGSGDTVSGYELAGNQLVIPLPQPLQPGESLILLMDYTLSLPPISLPSETVRPKPYGYTARQTNLVDWYPFIAPYRHNQGWLLHQPGVFGEHQVYDVADYDVQISLSSPVDGLVIAASAPVLLGGDTYRYHLSAARNFVWSASPLYQVSSAQVGEVMLLSYYFPTDIPAGEQALQDSSQALSLFSQLFSPYPYPSLSVVEADFPDGMEYNSLFFLSHYFYNLYDGTAQGYLTIIAAHETAHQWWYGLVGSDQALEPWLDEAMCTYSELIFYEHIYPDLLDWWWAFRIEPYQPSESMDGTIYDYSSSRLYRDNVYLHGAQFIEALRTLAGDQAFFAFLQDYAASLAGQQATAGDFFVIFQRHSDKDLNILRQDYFSSAKE